MPHAQSRQNFPPSKLSTHIEPYGQASQGSSLHEHVRSIYENPSMHVIWQFDKSTLGATEMVGEIDGKPLTVGEEELDGNDEGSGVRAFVGGTETVGELETLG